MKLITPALALSLAALTGQAQARDWGFSPDTVKEWDGVTYNEVIIDGVTTRFALEDTLRIWNTGADTIWFDTAWLEEIVNQSEQHFFSGLSLDFSSSDGFHGTVGGPLATKDNPLWSPEWFNWPQLWIDKSRDKKIIGPRFIGDLLSNSQKPPSNIVSVRAIYVARDRGQDTLIVVGDYTVFNNGGVPTYLNPILKKTPSRQSLNLITVNAQGRRYVDVAPSTQSNPTFSLPSPRKVGQ